MDVRDKAERFAALHREGTFVMPNAWDRGSARILEAVGFDAIATTSAGTNYANGTTDWDYHVPREDMIRDFGLIARAVDLPCNGDLENGYGAEPEAVAETIRQAIAAGMAGGGIEDHTADRAAPLYELSLAVDRITAAREAIDSSGVPFVLTGRAECYLAGVDGPFDESVRRLNAYAAAGADVLYAPGVRDIDEIAAMVRAVDRPLNVLVGGRNTSLTVDALAEAGVRRISIGGALFLACYGLLEEAATEMAGQGTFGWTSRPFVRPAF